MRLFALYSEYLDCYHVQAAGSQHLGSLQYDDGSGKWHRIYGRGHLVLRQAKSYVSRADAVLAMLRERGQNFEWLVEEAEDRWLAGVGERPEPDAAAVPVETGTGTEGESPAPPLRVSPSRMRISPAVPATSSTGSPKLKRHERVRRSYGLKAKVARG